MRRALDFARHVAAAAGQTRRARIIQHPVGWRPARIDAVIVPDRSPNAQDVEIAARLLRAYEAAAARGEAASSDRQDIWSAIRDQQSEFETLLGRRDPETLAEYLCNVSRHDASIGIVQGDQEYDRIVADRSYRSFLGLMAKDKLVSLAEAVGSLPIENPEQGRFTRNVHVDLNELVSGISRQIGIDIAPPDIDGGLLKLRAAGELFGERDATAIFTAWLLGRVVRRWQGSRICEIGAGSGRAAYWGQRLGLGSHTIIDLPLVNVVQGYYLLRSLPSARIALYGEPVSEGEVPDITIWPNHAIDDLPEGEFDVVLNQDSMPEMDRQTVDEYLDWIGRVCRGVFVSINQESRAAYGANLQHVCVAEAVAAGGFELVDRYPYWLRRGYVVELFAPLTAAAPEGPPSAA